MLEVVIVLLIVIFAAMACLTWICVTLINNRLDTPSIERFAKAHLDQVGDAYRMGFNQRITSDVIQPTGPIINGHEPAPSWDDLDESEPHIPESEVEDIT